MSIATTPDWLAKNAVYQINPRTFCREGTIRSVIRELPFLADMGFGVIYLCPIFEEDASEDTANWSIRQVASGTENPKNPYRMNNYFKIDPEYGTMDDLRDFVSECHRLGLRALLDLVYLHMGPNADLFRNHPEYTKKNKDGSVFLNYWHFPEQDYSLPGVREYMWCNMVYYVGEIGADGFRCDVGDGVPLDFWAEGVRRIRTINPEAVLIDEGENFDSLSVFHSVYTFPWHECLFRILNREDTAEDLVKMWHSLHDRAPKGGRLLRDMDNHDTATDWGDKRIETLAGHDGMELIQVLNYIIDGIPMVYSGNELADTANVSMFANRFHPGKYEFTDRIHIFSPESLRRQSIMKELNRLKKESDVLYDGETIFIDNSQKSSIISFRRNLGNKAIVFVGNITPEPVSGTVDFSALPDGKVLLTSLTPPAFQDGTIRFAPYSYTVVEVIL